jgi:nicotinamidase-related amidase
MTNDNKSALLVMDMQMGIVSRLPQQGNDMIKKVAGAIKFAREKNITVIFVRVGFRKGMPEISNRNHLFLSLKTRINDNGLDAFMQIHPALGRKEADWVIDKKRVSAFCGNDLEMILQAQNISHLVLAGVSTSGVVLSTVRQAFDKDYELTVLSDGCEDTDAEVHQFLLQKVLPKQATVMSIDDWKASVS